MFNYKFNKKPSHIDEIEKQPAYKRMGIELDEMSNQEANISRTSLNTDEENNYPNKDCKDKKTKKPFANWIEVGALSWKTGEDAVATFSNYGKVNVDVFAPGVDIYATVPGSEYESLSGTSMASPVTAGVAALVWSYYPELSVKELRKCIVESTVKLSDFVSLPGSNGSKQVEFKDLCNTSGVVNAYKALQMADKIMASK